MPSGALGLKPDEGHDEGENPDPVRIGVLTVVRGEPHFDVRTVCGISGVEVVRDRE